MGKDCYNRRGVFGGDVNYDRDEDKICHRAPVVLVISIIMKTKIKES